MQRLQHVALSNDWPIHHGNHTICLKQPENVSTVFPCLLILKIKETFYYYLVYFYTNIRTFYSFHLNLHNCMPSQHQHRCIERETRSCLTFELTLHTNRGWRELTRREPSTCVCEKCWNRRFVCTRVSSELRSAGLGLQNYTIMWFIWLFFKTFIQFQNLIFSKSHSLQHFKNKTTKEITRNLKAKVPPIGFRASKLG